MDDKTTNKGALPFASVKGALPFAVERGFTQVPNAVMRHYQYYPKFNGNTLIVYAYLLSQYNGSFGYAFPTHMNVSLALNMTEKTARAHIKTLTDVGLVEVTENGRFGNHTYTFRKPIEDEAEFYRLYPQAYECWRKVSDSLAKDKADKDARKAEMLRKDSAEITSEDDDIDGWL